MTYRWSHPIEWLTDHIANASEDEVRRIARELADQLDGDQIQDLYQSDMDADGYFTKGTDDDASSDL